VKLQNAMLYLGSVRSGHAKGITEWTVTEPHVGNVTALNNATELHKWFMEFCLQSNSRGDPWREKTLPYYISCC